MTGSKGLTGEAWWSTTVAVHGLGYVGTVTAACLADQGHEVIGIDLDPVKVAQLRAGAPPVVEPGLDDIVARSVATGRLTALGHDHSLTAELMDSVNVHIVCVGTPSLSTGAPDTAAVAAVVDELAAAIADRRHREGERFPVIVIRSTVLPGTVDRLRRDVEQRHGVQAGVDYGLAMCPEFLRETSAVADFFDPPFTVAGVVDERTADVVEDLFGFLDRPFFAVTMPTAETIKYACNAFHALKVTFANEVGRLAQASGADGRTVMDIFCRDDRLNVSAAYLRPGFAFGGSCLPKDLRALAHHGRRLDLELPLLTSVLISNENHLHHTIELILNVVQGPAQGRVALLGLTFKTGTDDVRESPYVRLAETLIGKGVEVAIWDPDLDPTRLRGGNRRFIEDRLPHLAALLRSSADEALPGADVCVLGTSHPEALAALAADVSIPVIDAAGSPSLDVDQTADDYIGVAW
ncbi:MAG: nucleotide sugar dehydrogenase [Acidimicrobiales bacterium]